MNALQQKIDAREAKVKAAKSCDINELQKKLLAQIDIIETLKAQAMKKEISHMEMFRDLGKVESKLTDILIDLA